MCKDEGFTKQDLHLTGDVIMGIVLTDDKDLQGTEETGGEGNGCVQTRQPEPTITQANDYSNQRPIKPMTTQSKDDPSPKTTTQAKDDTQAKETTQAKDNTKKTTYVTGSAYSPKFVWGGGGLGTNLRKGKRNCLRKNIVGNPLGNSPLSPIQNSVLHKKIT
jgi:hypothetical protein